MHIALRWIPFHVLCLVLAASASAAAATPCDRLLMQLHGKAADAICFESADLTTNNPATTPANNSLPGLPPFAFTPQTDRNVIAGLVSLLRQRPGDAVHALDGSHGRDGASRPGCAIGPLRPPPAQDLCGGYVEWRLPSAPGDGDGARIVRRRRRLGGHVRRSGGIEHPDEPAAGDPQFPGLCRLWLQSEQHFREEYRRGGLSARHCLGDEIALGPLFGAILGSHAVPMSEP